MSTVSKGTKIQTASKLKPRSDSERALIARIRRANAYAELLIAKASKETVASKRGVFGRIKAHIAL